VAVRFDAAADRLTHSGSYPQTSAGFTLTAWARIDVDRNDFQTFMRLNDGGTLATCATENDGTTGPQYFTPSGSAVYTAPDNMQTALGTWVPIAISRNSSGTAKSYRKKDGTGTTEVKSGTISGVTGTPTEIAFGGRSAGDSSEWLNGALAFVRIWSTELTQAEIESEWASVTPVKTSGLHSVWRFIDKTDLTDSFGSKTLTVNSGFVNSEYGPRIGRTGVNLAKNPSASVNATGWTGTAFPTRVTGLVGHPRTTGLISNTSGSSYFRLDVAAAAPVTPGQVYTVSVWGESDDVGDLATCYLVWYDSGGADLTYFNYGNFQLQAANTPTLKVMGNAVAPAGAVSVGVIIDCQIGAILSSAKVEPGADPTDYGDGDSSGWVWDGTAGLSSSQESVGGGSTTGVIAGSLPGLTGSMAASNRGALANSLPSLTGALAGNLGTPGALVGALPALSGQLAGNLGTPGVLGGSLPPLGGSLQGNFGNSGVLGGTLPAFAGRLLGTQIIPGVISGLLPTLVGELTNFVDILLGNPEELRVNRINTRAFIRADPIQIALKTRVPVRSATGGFSQSAGTPRALQTFKLIMQSPAGSSLEQRTEDGTERQVDYILLGEYNAQVYVGDWWEDGNGNVWEVRALVPANGYETRAVVEAHGKVLTGG